MIDVQRRRVYAFIMADVNARNSEYWLRRLLKDGHSELLARVQAGEIKVYKACQLAGYRRTGPRAPAATLSHHWKRASAEERKRFVLGHLREVNRVLKEVGQDLKERKAEKSSLQAGK